MNSLFSRIGATVVLSWSLCFSVQAHAELIKVDLVTGSNDQKITRDTNTGLDWLNVPLTANQTFDQVRTGPYYGMGFRHATREEFTALFTNAGLVDDWFNWGITQPEQAMALVKMLGATIESETRASTLGLLGTDYHGNTISTGSHPLGTVFSALLGKVEYFDMRASGLGLAGEAHFTGGHPFSNQADPGYGSYLVRQSPVDCRLVGNSQNPKCKGQGRGQY